MKTIGTDRWRWSGRTMLLSLMMLSAAAIGGCNIGGWFGAALPPPPVPAEYVPRQEPMLVLCENYKDPGATYVEAEQLEHFVANEIERNHVAPLVSAGTLADVRSGRSKEFQRMSVVQIGKETGAAQVLYIHMERTSTDVAIGSDMVQGSGSARVKLIDIATGQTLWPVDTPEGRYVSADTPMLRTSEDVSATSVRRDIQQALAMKLVSFLYTYQPE